MWINGTTCWYWQRVGDRFKTWIFNRHILIVTKTSKTAIVYHTHYKYWVWIGPQIVWNGSLDYYVIKHIINANIWSDLFKSSTPIAVEESPVTLCWTSYPATSPCCTAGSRRLAAPSEEAAPERDLAPRAVGNGPWAQSADRRRNRRIRRSRGPSGNEPRPWRRSAETSRKTLLYNPSHFHEKKKICWSVISDRWPCLRGLTVIC